jgi:hypothetical protein
MSELVSLSAVATAVGQEKANNVIALTAIVVALTKQQNIDGRKLVDDIVEALTPGPGGKDLLRDLRETISLHLVGA